MVGINPVTGKQTLISSNTQPSNVGTSELLTFPYGLGTDGHGALVVADSGATGDGALIAINRANASIRFSPSNTQPINMGSSEFLFGPDDIEFYKGEYYASLSSQGVAAVNPTTGKQRLISATCSPSTRRASCSALPMGSP